MKISQLFYLPSEWHAAAFGGFAGLLAATVADWIPVSTSLFGESAILAALIAVVFTVTMAANNFFVRLRTGRWPADT